jgi:hypothetical protein
VFFLRSRLQFHGDVLIVSVTEGTFSGVSQSILQEVEGVLCEDSGNICYPFRAPRDAAGKNAAPISVSSDKLARLPTFFILETHFLRDRIFGCSCRRLSFPKDVRYFGHGISFSERDVNRVANQLTQKGLID